jgi:hypothetical protein
MCIIGEVLLGTVESSVAEMQADEAAIRNGLDLAGAVREQYIHQAQVLVERSEHHMDQMRAQLVRPAFRQVSQLGVRYLP